MTTRAFPCGADEGAIVDAAFSPDGSLLATGSDEGEIAVLRADASGAADGEGADVLHTERLADGEVPLQLAWAHLEFGALLAIATSRGSVAILQGPAPLASGSGRADPGWCVTSTLHCAGARGVSAIAFGPRQHGLVLAVACSQASGRSLGPAGGSCVLIYEGSGAAASSVAWTLLGKVKLAATARACHCLCWREASAGLPPLLAVGHEAGGAIFAHCQPSNHWMELCHFAAPPGVPPGPLQALHWAPALGRPTELLAASFGQAVAVFSVLPVQRQDRLAPGGLPFDALEMSVVALLQHPVPVWKLEFNLLASTLACSLDGTPEVWLWMPGLVEGQWRAVTRLKGRDPAELADGDETAGDPRD